MTASLSVAVLLPGVGSVTAASGVTVAVFASVPVALGATVPSSTNVTEPPGASCTAAPAMSPDPDDVTQVPPGAGVQVHDAPSIAVGTRSETVAAADDGPALLTTMT